MIEVQHLTKRYGPFTAVDDVSFRVESGEILGMIDSGTGVKDTPKGVVPRLGLAGVAEYPG